MPRSPDIGQNSDGGISRISGQSFMKENCRNSRTSNDIDMKLKPVTKIEKKPRHPKKNNDGVILANCEVIVIFQFMGNLEQSGRRIRMQSL